ncbi:MAG: UPF0182 family protein [Acidimicrobiales bacterium]
MDAEQESSGSRAPIGRRRVIAGIVVVAVIALLASFRGILGLYTDYLWYDDLDRTSVWTGILGAQIVLSVVFVSMFFVITWLNLVIADRIAPALRPPGPEEELLARWHETAGRRNGLIRFVIAGFFALVTGGGAASQWNEWILFTNQVDFDQVTDPVFGQNVSFYVFRLPFLSFVVNWFFAAFVIIGILTAVWHYINGGIRIQTVDRRTTPQVKAHLSVLLAILALLKAAQYWLQRYELLVSPQGFGRGAFYTDLNANLPAIQLLLLISLFSVLLLVANIWRRGWALPSIAVGLWALIAVIAGGIYPAVIQQFQVGPDELQRERQYIDRNIVATRTALGLDQVVDGDFTYTGEIDRARLDDQRDIFSNVRLLDPRIIDDSFTRNQQDRAVFDSFADGVDVDRYMIDGDLTSMVVGVRELNNSRTGSWENRHLVETHGYGIVMAPADRFNSNGRPDFVVRDTPIENELDELIIDQPQVYFGDGLGGYGIVNTTRSEFDFIDGYRYDGAGGVPMSGFWKELAFAFRFGAIEPLISGTITNDSEVIFARDVTDRARRLAPFLHYDSDPYAVVVDGGVSYVIDAYTTSNMYPYGELADTRQLENGADLRHSFNYVRNSVKVVVDGYDGTVDFYVVDEEDPILEAYRREFGELFLDVDLMPAELKDHLRYPDNLFRVQTEAWGRYQLDDPQQFYNGILAWEVADNSDAVSGGRATGRIVTDPETGQQRVIPDRNTPTDPYYQVTRLPDEEDPDFVITRPFVPTSRPELTAYVVGRSNERGQLELRQYEMSTSDEVFVRGPFQIDEILNADPAISEETTELGQSGSQFLSGNLMVLLVDEAVVYIRPFYVRSAPENPTEPTEPVIEFVAAVQEDRIGFAPTYAGALAELFDISIERAARLAGTTVPLDDAGPSIGPDDTAPTGTTQRLADILDKFAAAEQALPDFVEFERLRSEALAELQQLQDDLAESVPDALGEETAEEPAAA